MSIRRRSLHPIRYSLGKEASLFYQICADCKNYWASYKQDVCRSCGVLTYVIFQSPGLKNHFKCRCGEEWHSCSISPMIPCNKCKKRVRNEDMISGVLNGYSFYDMMDKIKLNLDNKNEAIEDGRNPTYYMKVLSSWQYDMMALVHSISLTQQNGNVKEVFRRIPESAKKEEEGEGEGKEGKEEEKDN